MKTAYLHVRVSPEELAGIDEKAKELGIQRSAYVIRCALGAEPLEKIAKCDQNALDILNIVACQLTRLNWESSGSAEVKEMTEIVNHLTSAIVKSK